jgi:WGR domain-containing protein
MSEHRLAQAIIVLSFAQTWTEAKLEWELSEVYEVEKPETCLCGHFPIIELCVLVNKVNGQKATVGNCCVKQFLGLPSGKIFQAVKRVRKDPTKSLNAETIRHAFKKGWITEWEKKFCFDTMRKKNLSDSQTNKKIEINEKILRKMRKHSSA